MSIITSFFAFFSNLSPWETVVLFFVFAFFVIFSTILIPRFLTELFRQTKIGNNFIALILVAIITSTPELISIVFGPLIETDTASGVERSFANVFGSNILTTLLLVIFQLVFFYQLSHSQKFTSICWTLFFIILFNVFYFLLMIFPEIIIKTSFLPDLGFINIFTFVIVVFYSALIIFLFFGKKQNVEMAATKSAPSRWKNFSSLHFALGTLFFMIVLVLSMIILLQLTSSITQKFALDQTLAGGIFLALVTVFPEIWTATGFFLMGMYVSGIGVFVGSQIFNMVLLTWLAGEHSNQIVAVSSAVMPIIVATIIANTLLLINYVISMRTAIGVRRLFFLFPLLIVINFFYFWFVTQK